MKIFLIKLYFCVLVSLVWPAFATVVSTPASKATSGLKDVIHRYLKAGGDINDLTMDLIMSMVDPEAANIVAQGRLADRFEILGGKGPIDHATMAKLLAYTSNRVGEDRRDAPGRYVIWFRGEEVYYNWESEEKVSAIFQNAGMKLVDRGPWTQPDTKAQSMFHVGIGPQPLPDDNREQEDQAGRRLPIPNAKSQNAPKHGAAQQPNITSEQRTLPDAKSSRAPKAPDSRPKSSSAMPASTPRLALAVICTAVIGLVWLLLKKRR